LESAQATDAPLNPVYLQALKQSAIELQIESKWLNAVSAYLTDNQVETLATLPFIKKIEPIQSNLIPTHKPQPLSFGERGNQTSQVSKTCEAFGDSWRGLKSEALTQAGLTGKAINIGIIDAGFAEADQHSNLAHLFQNKQIKACKDYINPKNKAFFKAKTQQDWHGREVWAMIAGKNDKSYGLSGFAPNANFYLARTDNGNAESRTEEDYWIAAIEWMDSLGVRLVNTSLGYAYHFDKASENYKPTQMDGKSTRISQIAQIATQEKGMILVVSAGNEGDKADWQVITAPADAEGVITVGATQSKNRAKIFYSSIGCDFLPYTKPDVTCPAGMGTSFAAPVITGMIACLLEHQPNLSPAKVHTILKQSAHLYPFGNNYIGYGIPQADLALRLLAPRKPAWFGVTEIHTDNDSYTFEALNPNTSIVIFHKKNERVVLSQEIIQPDSTILKLEKKCAITRSTVDLGNKVYEVIWE
jgi:hypothetical protein